MNYKSNHILLADDDDDDALLFTEAIGELKLPIKVTHVKDGREALHFLQNNRPDILFLDLNMPNVNGLECLQQIRSSVDHRSLPVIIYSTSNNTEYIEKCFSEGANKYLIKPYSYEGIVTLLRMLVTVDLKDLHHHNKKEQFVLAAGE